MVQPTASPPPATTLTAAQAATLVWRFKWWFCAGFIPAAVAVLWLLANTTPMYQAEAKIAIERAKQFTSETAFDPDTGLRVEFGQLNQVREELLARPILQSALQHAGELAMLPYSLKQDPVALLENRVRVITSRDSWALIVNVQAEHPDRATRLCEALLDAYNASLNHRRAGRAQDANALLTNQIEAAQANLDAAILAEQTFRIEHNVGSGTLETNPLSRRHDQLVQQGIELDRAAAQLNTVVERMAAAFAASTPDDRQHQLLAIERFASDPRVVAALAEQRTAAAQRNALALKFGPKHPRLIEAADALADRSRRLDEALTTVHAAITEAVESNQLQQRQLAQQREETETELATLREHLVKLQSLKDIVAQHHEVLGKRRNDLSRVDFASRMETNFINIIEPPASSLRPLNRSKLLFAAAAFLVGSMGGCLVAGIVIMRNRRLVTIDDVQRAAPGVAILGRIPHVAVDSLESEDPERPPVISETFRRLRSTLMNNAAGPILVVTSSQSGEGKTMASWRLAHSCSRSGQRVLLIDADLRRPRLSQVAKVDGGPGLADVLEGREAGLLKLSATLDILPAGTTELNPGDLITPQSFAGFLDQIRGGYDRVIIDSPPLGAVADALAAIDGADGVILVARSGLTDRRLLQETLLVLYPMRSKLLGILFMADRQVDVAQLLNYTGLSHRPPAKQPPAAPTATGATPATTGAPPGGTEPPAQQG